MTYKDIIEALDSVGLVLFDFDIKGKQALKMATVLQTLNTVRNEIEKLNSGGKEETE